MKLFSYRVGSTLAATLLASVTFSAAASAGCGSCCCGQGAVYAPPLIVEAAPLTQRYIVDQGPVYSGPAISIPFLTYSESLSAHRYPYVREARRHYVRGYDDVYSYTGGPYAHPMNHYSYGYGHRYPSYVYRNAGPRVIHAPRRNVVRARAEVRYVSPERMEIKLQRDHRSHRAHGPRHHHED